jgi:hypothetical protein
MVRPVPSVDIAYPLFKAKTLSSWSGSQVAEHKRVIRGRILGLKLTQQNLTQTPDLCLINSARMMRDETRESTPQPVIPNPPRTIERVKTRLCQFRSIANIMQISCRHQQVTIGRRNDMRDPPRLLPDLPHVRPARSQRRQESFRVGCCPRGQRHSDILLARAARMSMSCLAALFSIRPKNVA